MEGEQANDTTPLAQLSRVTATHTRTQGCRAACRNHRCPSIFWKLLDDVHGEELRERAVSATRGARLETQVEVWPSDLDLRGQGGERKRGLGRGRGVTDSSALRQCSGFSEGHPDLPAHVPREFSGHPDALMPPKPSLCHGPGRAPRSWHWTTFSLPAQEWAQGDVWCEKAAAQASPVSTFG